MLQAVVNTLQAESIKDLFGGTAVANNQVKVAASKLSSKVEYQIANPGYIHYKVNTKRQTLPPPFKFLFNLYASTIPYTMTKVPAFFNRLAYGHINHNQLEYFFPRKLLSRVHDKQYLLKSKLQLNGRAKTGFDSRGGKRGQLSGSDGDKRLGAQLQQCSKLR